MHSKDLTFLNPSEASAWTRILVRYREPSRVRSVIELAITAGAFGLEIDTCYMEFNTTGLLASAATARIANCRITGNTNGINFTGGVVQSFGDNKVKGNSNDQLGGAVGSVPAPVKI